MFRRFKFGYIKKNIKYAKPFDFSRHYIYESAKTQIVRYYIYIIFAPIQPKMEKRLFLQPNL